MFDDRVGRKKYNDHKHNAIQRGYEPLPSYQEYKQKLIDAGITPSDVGNGDGKYQLGRLGDTGNYTVENCRFITHQQNIRERDENGGSKLGRTKADDIGCAAQADKISRYWRLEKGGEEVIIKNLTQFCKDNGLNQGNMYNVLDKVNQVNGKPRRCKGWAVYTSSEEEFNND